ncbi:hypothetical protein RCH20_002407 [Psychrobacter sp. PL15]|uniref:hypothetical protein n=1 Tax=Psychrobacter sp. PL15 TaxID=3071719 RepID=UPI002E039A5B|nr:hypothetical protein [Psychrobacter sp. PL15]
MSKNTRFDYYCLNVNKKRKSRKKQGQIQFGLISSEKIFSELQSYYKNNIALFNSQKKTEGMLLRKFHNDKKWVRWISIEKQDGYYKLLLCFYDSEVDDRIVENIGASRIKQKIPDAHGLRTLVHIVVKADSSEKMRTAPNICIQSVIGLTRPCIKSIIAELLALIDSDLDLLQSDAMTEEDIECFPNISFNVVTTDTVLDDIKKGLLNGVLLTGTKSSDAESDVKRNFDSVLQIGETTASITVKIEKNTTAWEKITESKIFKLAENLKKENEESFDKTPTTYLLIKNEDTGSEIKHEILDGVLDGFAKRTYLKWEERDLNTHSKMNLESPEPVKQFYDEMINNF